MVESIDGASNLDTPEYWAYSSPRDIVKVAFNNISSNAINYVTKGIGLSAMFDVHGEPKEHKSVHTQMPKNAVDDYWDTDVVDPSTYIGPYEDMESYDARCGRVDDGSFSTVTES